MSSDDLSPEELPLVSIGIPLYRSREFADIISQNIERVDYPRLEWLIADQHGLDDTIDVLRQRFGDDPRCRFFSSTDELPWSENYNFLFAQATGRYFSWLAHDDEYTVDAITKLVACLQHHPQAILAIGNFERIDRQGKLVDVRGEEVVRPRPKGRNWSFADSLRVFTNQTCRGAFRGLFDREQLCQANLTIRPTWKYIEPERAFLFGASLHGTFEFVPAVVYRKRIYPESLSASWTHGPRHALSYSCTGCRYLIDSGIPLGQLAWKVPVLFFYGIVMNGGRRLLRRLLRRHERPTGQSSG